jgi:hypothetical protein
MTTPSLIAAELFLCWDAQLIPVLADDVREKLRAATAINDPTELHQLRRQAKRNKDALQYACINHVLTGAPLQLVQRTTDPHSYDLVGHLLRA